MVTVHIGYGSHSPARTVPQTYYSILKYVKIWSASSYEL